MLSTLPNFLTLLRILAVPCFAIALVYGYAVEASIIFALAALTDLLDGFIARRFNQVSALGTILDPAADKLLMTCAFWLLAFPKVPVVVAIPVWVAILAISRDVLIALTALLAYDRLGKERFQPSWLGKVTTTVEMLAISLALLINAFPVLTCLAPYALALSYGVALLVLASGMHYFFRATSTEEQA